MTKIIIIHLINHVSSIFLFLTTCKLSRLTVDDVILDLILLILLIYLLLLISPTVKRNILKRLPCEPFIDQSILFSLLINEFIIKTLGYYFQVVICIILSHYRCHPPTPSLPRYKPTQLSRKSDDVYRCQQL